MRTTKVLTWLFLFFIPGIFLSGQTFYSDETLSFGMEYEISGGPGYLISDPGFYFKPHPNMKVKGITGMGFFQYNQEMQFLQKWGMGLELGPLGVYGGWMSQYLDAPVMIMGEKSQQGGFGGIKFKPDSSWEIGFRGFTGWVSGETFKDLSLHQLSLDLKYQILLDLQNTIDIITQGQYWSETANPQANLISFSIHSILLGGLFTGSLEMHHAEQYSGTRPELANELNYHFGTWTLGAHATAKQGRTALIGRPALHILPLENTTLFLLNSLDLFAFADLALFWSGDQYWQSPEGAWTVGSGVAMSFFGTKVSFRFGYRPDYETPWLWKFEILSQ